MGGITRLLQLSRAKSSQVSFTLSRAKSTGKPYGKGSNHKGHKIKHGATDHEPSKTPNDSTPKASPIPQPRPVSEPTPSPLSEPSPSTRTSRFPMGTVALGLAAAGGAAAYFWWEQEKAKWGPGPVVVKEAKSASTGTENGNAGAMSSSKSGLENSRIQHAATSQGQEDSIRGPDDVVLAGDTALAEVGAELAKDAAATSAGEVAEAEVAGKVEGEEKEEDPKGLEGEKVEVEQQDMDGGNILPEEEKVLHAQREGEEEKAEEKSTEGEKSELLEKEVKDAEVETEDVVTLGLAADAPSPDSSRFSEEEIETGKEREFLSPTDLPSPIHAAAQKLSQDNLLLLSLKKSEKEAEEGKDEGKGEEGMGEILSKAVASAMAQQAKADEEAFQTEMEKIEAHHNNQVQQLEASLGSARKTIMHFESLVQRQRDACAHAVREIRSRGEADKEAVVKQQAARFEAELEGVKEVGAATINAAVAKANVESLEALEGVLLKLRSLHAAFFQKSEETKRSHEAHQLTMGVLALEDALEKGSSVIEPLAALEALQRKEAAEEMGGGGTASEQGGGVVSAVVRSFPHPDKSVSRGLATVGQLQIELARREGSLAQMAMLPAHPTGGEGNEGGGGGGVLAHALAWVASSLKIAEPGTHLPNGGPQAAVSRAKALLLKGHLGEAATVLEDECRGTGAEGLAREWAASVRARAEAEQALELLRAYALTEASALS